LGGRCISAWLGGLVFFVAPAAWLNGLLGILVALAWTSYMYFGVYEPKRTERVRRLERERDEALARLAAREKTADVDPDAGGGSMSE
ncbi:MAG TPA: hypothetical protein VMD47_13060, partial [Candidatus Acidoferrales bacterium]|nr:hypothetical protein [Candidatus Acidoferrales bacterium]